MNKIFHWIIISIAVMGYIACADFFEENVQSLSKIISDKTIKNGEHKYKGYTEITIQETVTSIGASAFEGNKLSTVTIPKSVEHVGERAFVGNPLEKVILSKHLYNILKDRLHGIFGMQVKIYQDFDGKNLRVKKPLASGLKEASIQFASKFYAAAVTGENSDKNVLISPYGLKSVLAMTALTFSEENEKKLARAIFLNPDEDYVTAVSTQLKALNSNNALTSANRVWVDDNLSLNKETMNRINTYFDSPIHQLDLGLAASTKTINDELARLTNNKIMGFFQSIPPLTKVILANALYFKADWKYKFKEAKLDQWKNFETEEKDITFYNSVKKTSAPLTLDSIMYVKSTINNIPYFTIEGKEIRNRKGETRKSRIEVASIPYKDGKTSMIIILPGTFGGASKNFRSLEDNIEELLPTILDKLDTPTKKYTGDLEIAMPKFKTTWDGSLMPMLEDLGMDFLNDASFDRLSNEGEGITIDDIKQKTFIELTLTGTEAAAVTGVDGRNRSLSDRVKQSKMLLNRSFLYLIRDTDTGAVLFMGRFLSPSEE